MIDCCHSAREVCYTISSSTRRIFPSLLHNSTDGTLLFKQFCQALISHLFILDVTLQGASCTISSLRLPRLYIFTAQVCTQFAIQAFHLGFGY